MAANTVFVSMMYQSDDEDVKRFNDDLRMLTNLV